MDGKLWSQVYQTVLSIEHPEEAMNVTHSDRTIVLIQLRAAADDQPVSWGCRPENWAGLTPPPTWPSQPTMSRRLRTPSVQALYTSVLSWLKTQPGTTAVNRVKCGFVRKLDGRALTINPFSKDPDARWGWALRGYGFGYKLHAESITTRPQTPGRCGRSTSANRVSRPKFLFRNCPRLPANATWWVTAPTTVIPCMPLLRTEVINCWHRPSDKARDWGTAGIIREGWLPCVS